MKRNLLLTTSAFIGLTLASCTARAANPSNAYSVNATLSADDDGSTAYIINFDNGEKIDSVIVDNGMALFAGTIDTPVMARLIVAGDRCGTFILEPGQITLANKVAHGTALNQRMDSIDHQAEEIVRQFRMLPNDSTSIDRQKALSDQYDTLFQSSMEQNIDNPIGYYLFLQKGYEMSLDELRQALAAHPSLSGYTRVNKLLEAGENKLKTSEGHQFADFEIAAADGTTQRLSDYVGRGKWVLVDFWASWCGPCIRETAVIKEILQEYGPKGLEVLGVAVWDEPDNTRAAIAKHQLPWPQIINAQSVPTEIYGISGIPCIILFAPDGTIVSRDKQDQELKAAVAAALK